MTQADSVHSTPPLNTSANNPPGAPENPQDSRYFKTPITPEEIFKAIGRLRKEARDEIHRLIQFLDSSDNHMELEPEDEDDEAMREPSLGSLDRSIAQTRWGAGCCDDTEHEHDGREPDESGIGDYDGLMEQVGTQDWQNGGQG
jgi:hypothetical protein